MDRTAENLVKIGQIIEKALSEFDRKPGSVKLIAVSKTFSGEQIRPALEAGQRIFGENRVQESQGKWPQLKTDFPDTELHLIGPLQSNKVKEAVVLFDVIQTIDREKIAKALASEMVKQARRPGLFVQVNTGMEEQKAGIDPQNTVDFVERCRTSHGLEISGLMCIPPFDENPGPHFALLQKLAGQLGVDQLSMGMSADFETAIQFGTSHIRVGTAIFGARPPFKPAA